MAKKGNTTLNDLNEFLKKKPIEDDVIPRTEEDFFKQKPKTLIQKAEAEKKILEGELEGKEASEYLITKAIQKLAEVRGEKFRVTLLKVIQNAIESREDVNSTDIMLLNSAMYYLHTEKLLDKIK